MTACTEANVQPQLANVGAQPIPDQVTATTQTPTPSNLPTSLPATNTPEPTATPMLPTFTPTPFYTGPTSPDCGQILPLLPQDKTASATEISANPEALANLLDIMPATAVPAWQRLMDAPETVGLVAFQVGDEANGIYLNADKQMPLASVSKLIHLATYAEAVGAGELAATTSVPLEDLEAYYLPNLDLGGHRRALAELEENEKVYGLPPNIALEEVPWMMIRHSSNAATDYLHQLLGQNKLEETAVSLGLSNQTAPCPWVGQFLIMSNHTRSGSDQAAIAGYLENATDYGRDVSLLTDAYVNNEDFRAAAQDRILRTRLPSVDTQRYFGQTLNAHGTPREYADLMATFAQNGLSNPESSFIARKYLEWPMVYPDNQTYFSNLGYKNGSLPGILTTVYYAYPIGNNAPIIVALFYENLPNRTYQQWRRNLPHDEFARWLLYDPLAIPTLRIALNQ